MRPGGRLYLATGPTYYQIPDRAGQLVQFVLMPYPTCARYLDDPSPRYNSLEERHQALQEAFAARLRQFQQDEAFRPDLPTVLAAHIHVAGARLPTPFRMTTQESLIFDDKDVPADWSYVALGHIHQPQFLGAEHVRYSGSIERLDLGEKDDRKGVVLIDIGPEGLRTAPAWLRLEATPILERT